MKHQYLLLIALVVVCVFLCALTAHCAVVYVKPDGFDGNDGKAWVKAKASIQAGLSAAEPGDEVWVASGTYQECVVLKRSVALLGGFTGNEDAVSQRDWKTNRTIIDGRQQAEAVLIPALASESTRIDGFTVRNGKAGITCEQCAPVITNNEIAENSSYGICVREASPTISHNTVSNNGSGIDCCATYSYTIITYNTITGNGPRPGVTSPAVNLYPNPSAGVSYARFLITNNIISNNKNNQDGGGIRVLPVKAVISNNIITGNSAVNGGGIYLYQYGGIACNNTITGNTATAEGGGIYIAAGTVVNNIVAWNTPGLHRTGSSPVTLAYNCFYGNTEYNYSGITAGAGDISQDPEFVSSGDYHLQIISPCINSGSNEFITGDSVDIDGELRILPSGGTVDMGADEYSSQAVWSPGEAKRLVRDGQPVTLTSHGPMTTTAVFTDIPAFYVQQAGKAAGIQCRGESLLYPGQSAVLSGTMGTVNWERVLLDASIVEGSLSSISIPTPLGVNNHSLGGGPFGLQQGVAASSDLNNIGLLVRSTGRVISSVPGGFMIDDGSGVSVKVLLPSGAIPPPISSYTAVTGISSCEMTENGLQRLLRVRWQQDIQILVEQ